jgi:phenylpropionate dioxygenase-like ring-hydroxylating dioxygenase large terminal subunit
MIRNQWYAVLESKELKKGKLLGVTRLGEKLVFWRDESGEIGCIFDKCTHRGAALSKGRVLRNNNLQCPFHGFEYDKTGKVIKIPAHGQKAPVADRYKVHSYPVREAFGFIWLWWGKPQDDYPSLPFFKNIDEKFFYNTSKNHWAVHYSRAIENQLDVVHLPFVHYNTIGKGCRTIVDGPIVEVGEKRLVFWVLNRKDDGTQPRTAEEISKEDCSVHLEFNFPNIWQNYIDEKIRIFAAFVPIDEENTLIYLRFYQKFFRLPILGKLITKMSNRYNRRVLNQDKRVVLTQMPKKTQLKMSENLIPGDRPIIEYRKIRNKLLQKNNY